MGLSFWQIALVVVLFLLLFGRGKIPQLMTDLAQGIKSFKKGVEADEPEQARSDDRLTGTIDTRPQPANTRPVEEN
ncbi:twin-arginine translocase TatA/TatE family subunit [Kineobactrum salinum]|uniref:Sec-independent protein translocase protein TatA n=1 Tax=Kineobactrum salinum TaxID=2708301 RepID=A0A6C0TYI7_9GAMM|nr:twin-arginine translocase TatA/TatE family subunit [Kineobactrum salinum]QIB64890.1 twin-arginine translocase TatA/TatE family subunit [Kineobactrum salinum]